MGCALKHTCASCFFLAPGYFWERNGAPREDHIVWRGLSRTLGQTALQAVQPTWKLRAPDLRHRPEGGKCHMMLWESNVHYVCGLNLVTSNHSNPTLYPFPPPTPFYFQALDNWWEKVEARQGGAFRGLAPRQEDLWRLLPLSPEWRRAARGLGLCGEWVCAHSETGLNRCEVGCCTGSK